VTGLPVEVRSGLPSLSHRILLPFSSSISSTP
jgi:hypothetical protein